MSTFQIALLAAINLGGKLLIGLALSLLVNRLIEKGIL